MQLSLIHRLPIRWVILGATLAALGFSFLIWCVGAYWLGQNFLWYSQEYRMLAQVRMVWTGEDLDDQGNRRGLPISTSLQQEAEQRVRSLTTPATAARIFDLNGRLLAESPGPQAVGPAEPEQIQAALDVPQDVRNRHLAYAVDGNTEDWMVVLLPIRFQRQDVGVLQFSSLRRQPREVTRKMLGYLSGAAAVAFLVSIAAALWVARWLAEPMERLRQATLKLQKGDLKARTGLAAYASHNEVYQVSAAFDQMADFVEKSLEAQRRFVADASHELKTPLTSIGGMADMLKLGQDPEKQRKAIDIICRESDRMSRLVADLLTLSKAGQKPAEQTIEHLCLGLTLKEAVETMATTHPDREIEVEAEEGLYLMGNRDELARLIRNLLDNAVQHTPPTARVRAVCRLTPEGILLEVTDEGPGIEAGDLPHLFERFYRPDSSRARKTGGSGLGLAIVESIAVRHGGRVQVTSELGKGSCFSVLFAERK
jgi:two-component system OmpR family sensor kinase